MQQQAALSPLSPRAKKRGHGGVGESPWEVEADISALLSKHSVEEVRKIEQRTRLDIERKKEELRQMVGERYRDLIDAADSIVELQTGSHQVGASLGHMIRVCQSLQQTHFLRGLGGLRGPPVKDETHEAMARMKVLGDAPEQIWKCLEKQQYLEATRLFLVARHTHTQLQVTLVKNTLLQRLWQVASGFRSTILECCRQHLQSPDQSTAAMLSSLCAIILLESCSLRQAFSQFLLAQKAAIQAVFHPAKQMHCSVKSLVSEAVLVIRRSIILTASIFCLRPAQGSSLLLQTVKDFTDTLRKASASTGVKSAVAEVPLTDLRSSCHEWLTACVQDVREGMKPLLTHVSSVKALSSIRAAIHSLLSQWDQETVTTVSEEVTETGDDWCEKWRELSQLLFAPDHVCIWKRFLQDLFFDRASAILTKHFSTAEEQAVNSLHQLLNNLTSDPTRYSHDIDVTSQLWVEEPAGMVPGARVRLEREERGRKREINSLTLRAKACTPSVYRFCQEVGALLEVIVEDSSHYLLPQKQESALKSGHISELHQPSCKEEGFPFRLHGDHDEMQQFLRNSTIDFVKRFLAKVQQTVTSLSSELQNSSQCLLTSNAGDRLLLIARVCYSLPEFCSPLSHLSHGCSSRPTSAATTTSRQRLRNQRTTRQKEEPETITAEQMLSSQGFSTHRIWAEFFAKQFVAKFRDQLVSSTELNALSCSLVWDEVSILEEAESGKQISSVIKVPSQASVYVTSLLFSACQEVSRVGGHTMERSVLQYFTGKCLCGVLEVHHSFLAGLDSDSTTSGSLHQNCALQLLFNVRFLCSALSSPPDMEEGTTKLQHQVLEQIYSHIDPFDLSVFSPHILSALERQLHRSTVLLGLLLALRGSAHHVLSGQKSRQSASQEKHILVPLFPSAPRFTSLPTVTPAVKPSQLGYAEEVKSPGTFMETVAFFHHM